MKRSPYSLERAGRIVDTRYIRDEPDRRKKIVRPFARTSAAQFAPLPPGHRPRSELEADSYDGSYGEQVTVFLAQYDRATRAAGRPLRPVEVFELIIGVLGYTAPQV